MVSPELGSTGGLTDVREKRTIVRDMQTAKVLLAEALWPKARRRILGLLLAHPDEEWHLRNIARETDLAPATVQREVISLYEAGILTRRRDGNQVKYGADRSCPIFPELQGLVLKTVGLADVLRQALQPLRDRIDIAFVFGSLAKGEATSGSDVDLMVVGGISLRDLVPVLQDAERTLSREINPVTMSAKEFSKRIAEGEHFVTSVLRDPRIYLIGDENELERLAERGTTSQA